MIDKETWDIDLDQMEELPDEETRTTPLDFTVPIARGIERSFEDDFSEEMDRVELDEEDKELTEEDLEALHQENLAEWLKEEQEP